MEANQIRTSDRIVIVLVVAILFLSPRLARAQSSAALLVKPWEAQGAVEDDTSGYLLSGGHTDDTRDRFHLSILESQGRVRLFPGKEASPRFGYDLTLLNTHTAQPGFPSQLLDASVSAGTFLSKNNGWVTGISLGLGYAGDKPFGEGRAWYGRADFLLAKTFNEHDTLGIGIDYDGHRTYAPDIPLPGFGFSHEFDPTLALVVGLPVSSITWKPTDQWRIYADYELVNQIDVNIGYQFIRHWTAFADFASRQDAFWISELPTHHRLLYSQRRLEAGIRWEPIADLTITLAGGYAFSTDFRAGWDYRASRRYLYASDEPYVHVGVDFKF